MCEPATFVAMGMSASSAATAAATISTISTVASIAGVGLSAVGAYQQSSAQKSQAEYQAAVQRNNQIIGERRAADIEKRGEEEARLHKLKVGQLTGRQTVQLAGQGVDVTEGSSIDLLADTAELGRLDEEIIRNNTARAAYEARVEANNFGAQASLFDIKAAAQSPLLSGTTTLLTGAGNVASKWYRAKGTA